MIGMLYNYTKNKKAVTLMEIMLAVIILAFTFLPIISTIGTSMKDTDVTNSYVFAQATARNILDYVLDELPFNSITSANDKVGILQEYNYYDISKRSEEKYDDDKLKKFRELIGSDDNNMSGKLKDERGTEYNIILYVFPITANAKVATSSSEMLFTYLPRPEFEKNTKWFRFLTNPETASDKDKKDAAYIFEDFASSPYKFVPFPQKRIENAFSIGAINNTSTGNGYCVMKKIVLSITWTGQDKHSRSLVLYTMKANLDSEKL